MSAAVGWFLKAGNLLALASTAMLEGAKHSLGIPAALEQYLDDNHSRFIQPAWRSAPRSICLGDVLPLHEVGQGHYTNLPNLGPGTLHGSWAHPGMQRPYQQDSIHVPALQELGKAAQYKHWSCDIQRVEGLAAAKSNLSDYGTLDAFAEHRSSDDISEITQDQLRNLLSHREIRIVNDKDSGDYFQTHTWDERVFLVNSGGAHHFSAARYMAKRLGAEVSLTGRLKQFSINQAAAWQLREQFGMFAVPDDFRMRDDLHEAFERVSATYFTLPLPWQFGPFQVLLFPRSESASRRVIQLMKAKGIFDFGDYLIDSAVSQRPVG